MPSKARKPIEYTPASAGALFRPQTQVDQELDVIENPDDALPTEPENDAPSEPTTIRTRKRTNERSSERSTEPPSVAPSVAPMVPLVEEPKIRHSFDIPRSQLDGLYDIQDRRRRLTGRKPKMGDLVTQALAEFIAAHHEG